MRATTLATVALALMMSGCATVPYQHGLLQTDHDLPLRSCEPQIERGRPVPVLDTLGWIVGIPSKILLLDHRVDNHFISYETERRMAEYLARNELAHVKVRLNQYHPGDEWRRLFRNRSVGWAWRYTLGTLSLVRYTLVPGRLFGGDYYNPYTNTIHLYSDIPAIALHEGGHAKDFARRRFKGTYAAAYVIPGVPLWHEAIATSDALGYLHTYGSLDQQREAYRILYPAYGTYVGGVFGEFFGEPLAVVGGAAVGHVIGRVEASTLRSVDYSISESETMFESLPNEPARAAETVDPVWPASPRVDPAFRAGSG